MTISELIQILQDAPNLEAPVFVDGDDEVRVLIEPDGAYLSVGRMRFYDTDREV